MAGFCPHLHIRLNPPSLYPPVRPLTPLFLSVFFFSSFQKVKFWRPEFLYTGGHKSNSIQQISEEEILERARHQTHYIQQVSALHSINCEVWERVCACVTLYDVF